MLIFKRNASTERISCSRRRTASEAGLEQSSSVMDVTVINHVGQSGPGSMSTLALTDLLMLNAIVCGLEFCASAAFCYIPPLLLKAGIMEQKMSLILGVGPTLGFFLVPVIGRASDRCRSRFGRRRPFIFVLSLMLLLALFIIPYSRAICRLFFGDASTYSKTAAVYTMVCGAILLDFTCQTCLTPCEALLSDLTRGTTQHARCFTVYSFMVSIGGCVGYLITSVDWASNRIGVLLGGQEQSVFMVLVIIFSFSCFMTFGAAHEIPLDADALQRVDANIALADLNAAGGEAVTKKIETSSPVRKPLPVCDVEQNGFLRRNVSRLGQLITSIPSPTRCFLLRPLVSVAMSLVSRLLKTGPFRNLSNVPFVLRRLALTNYCSWTAVMGFNLFFTDFVGQAVYGGNPAADEGSEERQLYDHGVRVGSFGLLLHCVNSAAYASIIDRYLMHVDLRVTYFVGMLTFSLAMMMMVISQNVYVVIVMAALTGVGYATLTTVPFMLVTMYHEDEQVYFYDTGDGDGVPSRGMGQDFATLDSAYYLSQVMLTAVMGYIVHWTGTVLAYVTVAGLVGVVASMCATRLVVNKTQMQSFIRSRFVRTC